MTERRPGDVRRRNLPNVVVVTYALFLAGFYVVPNAVDLYKFYIAAVFLPGLFLLPTAVRQVHGSRIWLSLLAYLAYMLCSSLWSETLSLAQLWRDVRYAAYLLLFILLTVYCFQRNRRLPQAIMLFVTLVAIVAAAISVATFSDLAQLPAVPQHRLVGLGTMDNPNTSAFIYGFCGVFALDYARRQRRSPTAWFCGAGVLVIFAFTLLTQSNTALLALFIACATLLLTDRRHGRVSRGALLCGVLMVLLGAVFLAWSLGLISRGIDLGFANRLPIWQHVLQLWQQAPLFGQGYQVTPVLEPDGLPSIRNYAHSLFLSSLRDGGIVGLALLLVVYGLALRCAWQMAVKTHRGLYLSLFLFGLVCVLVDTDQIVTRPRELWVILWWPLACLIARELGLAGEGSSSPLERGVARAPKKA